MEVKYTNRGFEYIDHGQGSGLKNRLQQSSAIGDYEDAVDKPGSSFLWLNEEHLSREDVRQGLVNDIFLADYIPHVEAWLETGSLILPTNNQTVTYNLPVDGFVQGTVSLGNGHWIKKYPDQEGLWWVTLNWGEQSSVELATVKEVQNGFLVHAMGSFLFKDDILAVWSEPVVPPDMFKEL